MLLTKKIFVAGFFIALILISIFVSFNSTVSAQSASDLQKTIDDLKGKISDLQSQAKTLSSQIAIMDNQIKLTEARIEQNKKEIIDLTLDIDTATKKIHNLQESLDALSEVLLARIVATYISGTLEPWEVVLSSRSASDLLLKYNYLKSAQSRDKRLIFEVQQAKNDYSNQKLIFEDKKKKIEALKIQLERYTIQLSQEKKDKNALLLVTRNDEKIYQQKLQAALAEQAAIAKITAGGGVTTFVGKIKEGDVIGYVISGSSACSSGAHLHFELFKDKSIQDPSSYLSNKSVDFKNEPDGSFSFGGSWRWPLNDPILITQGYGMTHWARLGWYGGGPHTGIDIYSSSSSSVYSVKEGDLFKGSIACGGGQLLFSRVDQSDGIQTFYLHMIPAN
ncbi:MAG: hypothetical protein HYT07_01630 [Candidatus Levybacteria bacterium]|nr:hypothetical protein [Candidatus Levybacteria bacterium]